MKNIASSKSFALGFCIGIILFIGANYYTHVQAYMDILCLDCVRKFGFPFYFYKTGSKSHYEIILWTGLIIDIIVAILTCIGIGFVSYFIATKLQRMTLK